MKTITLLLLGVATLATADPGRSSADYTLFHENTTGAYGGRSTSADYTLDTSGGPAGSESTSTDYRHRPGFSGQLVDAIAIEISASPHHVIFEGNTRQLDASLVNGDGTIGASIEPVWSIVSGPVAISSTGLATPLPVYQHTGAVAGASYIGLSDTFDLFIAEADDDNYGSYAGDGLADWWQVENFGFDNPDAAPGLDIDKDSFTNVEEYLSRHDPNDAGSYLTTIITSPDTIELSKVISFRIYTLMRSTNLLDWQPTGLAFVHPPGPPITDVPFTDPAPPTGERAFYRVDISD